MAEYFALFVKFLEIAFNRLDEFTISNYFWRRITCEYKLRYRIVSGDQYHMNMSTAANLFRQVVELRKLIKFSEDFAHELWDNSTSIARLGPRFLMKCPS